MTTKRVTLNQEVRIQGERYQPNATVEVDEKLAKQLVKAGHAEFADQGPIFAHEMEMTSATRAQAHEALRAADEGGGINDVEKRAAATERFRGFKQQIRPIDPETGERVES